jgi:hypothetical protein
MAAGRPWTQFPNLFSLLAVGLLALNVVTPCPDLDFAWQVRTGELIVQTGNLRPPESFSYTINGQPVPEHEWLYEVILYFAWTALGHGGLLLLKCALGALTLLALAWRLRRAGVRWHGILLSLLALACIVSSSWNLRPLYCTSIFLVLLVGWLDDHCAGRRPLSWWLPAAMLLWANLHPGVIVGQAILAGAIAWEWLNRKVRLNPPLDLAALRRLTVLGVAGLAATFVAPDPIGRMLYPFKPELAHPIMRIFQEMQPLWTYFPDAWANGVGAYGVMAVVWLTVVLRFRQYRLWEVTTLLGLTGLANLAYRSLQDCMVVMLALGVPHLAVLLRQAAALRRRRRWASFLVHLDCGCKRVCLSPWFRFQPFWPALAAGLLAAACLVPPLARAMPTQEPPEGPVGAVAYIERHGLKGRFFSPPDYGAYLTWRLGPDRVRIYTDTRGFFFPPQLLEDSHLLPQMVPGWRDRLKRVLDEHKTDYFLLETRHSRGALWLRLKDHLDSPALHLDRENASVLLSAAQVRAAVAKADRARQARARGQGG